MNIRRSRDVPSLGDDIGQEAPPFEIDQASLIEYFKLGFNNFSGVWQNIVERKDFKIIRDLTRIDRNDQLTMPIETWVRIVYRYTRAFHATPRQRFKVLDTLIPLYYGRVASLVNDLKEKDRSESERHFEQQAQTFEDMKGYLIDIWKKKGA